MPTICYKYHKAIKRQKRHFKIVKNPKRDFLVSRSPFLQLWKVYLRERERERERARERDEMSEKKVFVHRITFLVHQAGHLGY